MKIKEDNITRILHWVFACFVLVMLGIGFYMANTEYSFNLYQRHKSLGIIFTAIIGVRIYWRFRHPWKSSPIGSKHEMLARDVAHNVLIVLLFVMPVMGLLSSGFSGHGLHLFDSIEIVPDNIDLEGNVLPFNADIYEIAKLLHKVFGYIFATLITLHIVAVLKHHFINKDGILIKMLKGK